MGALPLNRAIESGRRDAALPVHSILPFLLACLLPAAPGAARAQGELAARWGDCAPAGSLDLDPTAVCATAVGDRRLVFSFVPGADVTEVVGWTLVLDFASNASPLPPWWQVQPGGCRYTVPAQFVAGLPIGGESCVDAWSTTGSAVVQSLTYPGPGGDDRQFRVILGVGVAGADAFTLAAGETYLAGILSIRFANTSTCAGCTSPVCFVFNSAEVVRAPGAPGPSPQAYVTPSPAFGNQATWGAGTACGIVPARARTWGQIKSLYR